MSKFLGTPTALIFGIINQVNTEQEVPIKDVVQLFDTLYPGISYQPVELGVIASDIAKQDLAKMFPKLVGMKDEAAAIAAMGQTVEVKTVKPCQGYEWEKASWKERPAAVHSASAQAKPPALKV